MRRVSNYELFAASQNFRFQAQHVIIQAQHSARIGSLLATIGAKFEVVNYIHKRDNRENVIKLRLAPLSLNQRIKLWRKTTLNWQMKSTS